MNEIEAKAREIAIRYSPETCKCFINKPHECYKCISTLCSANEVYESTMAMADWMIQRFYKHLVERCFFTEEEAKEVCKAMEE